MIISIDSLNGFNYRFTFAGSREATMGGACLASGLDISNMYYNPAGSAFINCDAVFSSSVNTLNIIKIKRNFFSISPRANGKIQSNLAKITPGSTGIIFKLSNNFALGLAVINLDNFKFSSQANKYQKRIKTSVESENYLFGSSLSFKINNQLAIGFSLFLQRSKQNLELGIKNERDIRIFKSKIKNWSLLPIVGLRWHPTYNIKLGLSYSYESIYLGGTNDYYYFYNEIDAPIANNLNKRVKGQVKYPHKLAFGIAYEKSKSFTIAADIIYYFSMFYLAPHEFYYITESN
ncbi:MAG: hypothetical protein GY756_17065, partial [bacterium]|nr:hypothetical protein [bacterium]